MKPKKKYPYYQYSKWLGSRKTLQNMINELEARGVSVAVVKKKDRYSLWRISQEAVEEEYDLVNGKIEKVSAGDGNEKKIPKYLKIVYKSEGWDKEMK